MNKEQTAEAIKVMQAYVDGAEIEFRLRDSGPWRTDFIDEDMPAWEWGISKYRIKPKPREFVLELNTDGTVRNVLESSEAPWFDGAVHIKVREVLE